MLPDVEDYVQRLARHGAVFALVEIYVEQFMVGQQPAGADAEHIASLRQMIQIGDAVRQFHRVVEGQQVRAGSEHDVLSPHQRLRDEQVRRRHRFPRGGEMLAYPRFGQPVAVGHLKAVEVPLVRVPSRTLRRV